MDAIKFQCK